MPDRIFPSWAYNLPNVEIASYILDFLPTLTGQPVSSGTRKQLVFLLKYVICNLMGFKDMASIVKRNLLCLTYLME